MKKNIFIITLCITCLGLAGWGYLSQQSKLLTSQIPVNMHVPQHLKSRRMLKDSTKTADFHKIAGKLISYNEATGEYFDLQKKVTLKREHPLFGVLEEVEAVQQVMLTPAVEYHSHIKTGANLGCDFLILNANAQANQLVEVHLTDIAKASIEVEYPEDWATIARQFRKQLKKNTSGEKTYWIKDLVLMKRTTHILTDASATADALGSLIKTNGKLYYRAEEGSSEYIVGFDIFDVEKFIELCDKRGLHTDISFGEVITEPSLPEYQKRLDGFKQALEDAKYIPH